MKINKSLLLKIIKNEIKHVLYENMDEKSSIQVLRYLINITDTQGETNFSTSDLNIHKQQIKKLSGMDAEDALRSLIGKVNPRRIQMAANKLKINIRDSDLGILPDPIPSRKSLDSDIRSADEVADTRKDRHGNDMLNRLHEE
jgi:hypothetical protein